MTPIKTLIEQHGGQVKLAEALGKTQAQVSKWLKLGAYINTETGEVYNVSARCNPIGEINKIRVKK